MLDIEHIGLIGNHPSDLSEALEVVGGYHPDDPWSWPFCPGHVEVASETPLLGFSVDLNCCDVPDELAQVFSKSREMIAAAGYPVVDVEIPDWDQFELLETIYLPSSILSVEQIPGEAQSLIDREMVRLNREAATLPAIDHIRARQARLQVCRTFNRLFEDIDILVSLTQQCLPNRLDQDAERMYLTRAFDMTGQPAISIPAGQVRGFPVGIQLVGAMGEDQRLLRVAQQILQLLDN